jgi:hypothetical protein
MSLLTVSALLGIGCFAIYGALQLWLSWFPNLHPKERQLRQFNALACGLGAVIELVLMIQYAETAPWLLMLPASLLAPIWFNEKERNRLMIALEAAEASSADA